MFVYLLSQFLCLLVFDVFPYLVLINCCQLFSRRYRNFITVSNREYLEGPLKYFLDLISTLTKNLEAKQRNLLWTMHRNTDKIDGPPLVYDQQTAGACAKDSTRRQDTDTCLNISWNNFILEKMPQGRTRNGTWNFFGRQRPEPSLLSMEPWAAAKTL